MRLALLFGVALATFAVSFGDVPSNCLRCICEVESGGCKTDIECGDRGASCGPYQIQIGYWQDARKNGAHLAGSYRDCYPTMQCSEATIQEYMRRYATYRHLGRNPTCEDFARIHNGGPRGATERRKATDGYWKKIRGCMRRHGYDY